MDFIKTPYLQLPEPDGCTIMWETDVKSTTQLHVWEAICPECGDIQYSPQGTPQVFDGDDGYVHKIKVLGLKSGKDYCYRVISTTAETKLISNYFVFRTRSLKEKAFSFAVTSETGGSGSPTQIIEMLVKAITAERPDFLLFVGDMVDDGRRKQDWDDFLFTPFRDLICHTPFFHCAGNHEEHADYMKEFLATSEKGYYEFTYGCAHFIALDSTQLADYIEDNEGHYVTMKLSQNLTTDNPQTIDYCLINTDKLKEYTKEWHYLVPEI